LSQRRSKAQKDSSAGRWELWLVDDDDLSPPWPDCSSQELLTGIGEGEDVGLAPAEVGLCHALQPPEGADDFLVPPRLDG
jgi:hypothetical protein